MVVLTEELILQKTRSEDLASVRNLNLWGSDLSDVSILQRMPNVEVLSLSVNKIRSLKDFRNCRFLTELYLRKNNITDLMEVTHLQGLQNLQILWLCDNPCVGSSATEYRKRCIAMLPNICKLDNIDVTVKERTEAQETYGHLSPTHTPNHTGSESSLLGEYSVAGRTPSKALISPSYPLLSPLRETNGQPLAASVAPLAPGSNGSGISIASERLRQPRAPSNVLYAVLALVKELDGDQLLAVQSEVALRLQVLESSRH